jgi:hypothetical protein
MKRILINIFIGAEIVLVIFVILILLVAMGD